MDYRKAIEEIKIRRKNKLLANEQLIISALRQHEDLHNLDIEIRRLELAGKADDDLKTKEDTQKLLTLKKRRADIFSSLGISETVPYSCRNCDDTGLSNGKPCKCVINMSADGTIPLYGFEDSNLSVFADSDRGYAEKAYHDMFMFCQNFPDTSSKNVIIVGKTGTGKTFLASCVARHLQERGFSALFITAFDFVNRMLKYHTSPMDEKLQHLLPLIDCDLLIIDDLGTESMLKNVTVEYLYNILNERMMQGKHFMITTNLDQESLANRYGERVISRLCDKRLSTAIGLAENDLRRN